SWWESRVARKDLGLDLGGIGIGAGIGIGLGGGGLGSDAVQVDPKEVGQKLACLLALLHDLELVLVHRDEEGAMVEVVLAVDVGEGVVRVQVKEVDMVRITEVAVIANK
nr:hypothetical protein [Tanacetum cinerariifolium]